jgi:hypothetical protein
MICALGWLIYDLPRRHGRRVTGLAACLLILLVGSIALVSTTGSARIAALWNDRYERAGILGPTGSGPALSDPALADARSIGTINVASLPVMGPHFRRYIVSNVSGLSSAGWWTRLLAAKSDAVLARDDPADGTVSASERLVQRSDRFALAATVDGTRIYLVRRADAYVVEGPSSALGVASVRVRSM